MLYQSEIPITQSALLVVDAQDSFKVGPRWERRDNLDFERNVGALIKGYRAAGLPVFFFLHTDPDPGFSTDSPPSRSWISSSDDPTSRSSSSAHATCSPAPISESAYSSAASGAS